MTALLTLQHVTCRFGGLVAVNNLSMHIESGTIVGIIGPNGAGKSTLFNVLTGLYRATEGTLIFQGERINNVSAADIVMLGIARTFQNIRLFAFMSAEENVLVGAHSRMKAKLWDSLLHTPVHHREEAAMRAHARELLAFVGLEHEAQRNAHELPYGAQRRLEIARALASRPTLLLLDEPAAGMNASEKRGLIELIRQIRARGTTVVFIEHDMPLVMEVAEHLWVLDHGENIAAGDPLAVRNDPRVIAAYLGSTVPAKGKGTDV